MKQYHKIQTVYKRDRDNRFKTLLHGQYSLPEFEFLKNNIWVYTEKVDGTNIRVLWDDNKITFGGKTDNAQIPVPLFNRLNEVFLPMKDRFIKIFGDAKVCLYGEGYGAKIQKLGKLYGESQEFVLFDVKVANWWLERPNVIDIAEKLELDVVPIIGEGTLDEMEAFVKSGFNSTWGDFEAEGVVARPKVELVSRNGERIITKLKHVDFASK